jgi:hypothetical protein
MKPKTIQIFCALALLEGGITLFYLFNMNFQPGRGQIMDYRSLRILAAFVVSLGILAFGTALVYLNRREDAASNFSEKQDRFLVGEKSRLYTVQGGLLITAIFLTECYLLTYLGFPQPLRPLFVWGAVLCLQAWVILRIVYRDVYRSRQGLFRRIRAGWRSWLPIQRRVLLILGILGVVYFAFFIPANYRLDAHQHVGLHEDEDVIYPDVIRALQTGSTMEETTWNALGNWQWWYGFPYLPISAAVLIIPRLVFGNSFGQQLQLNMLLLRSFISVLPMTLLILFAVYLVTRYKSMWGSIGLFFFFAFLPGVFWFNIRFWHPDAIVVFLILLTLYLLEKDDLQFGRNFYLSAVIVGLTTAIKLWGLFFGITIAGYLLVGLITRRLVFRSFLKAGLFFLLAMLGTFILTSPTILVPYLAKGAVTSWLGQQGSILGGYEEQGFGSVYQTGLPTWLYFFGLDYMKPFFFFFAFLALGIGSLLGTRKAFNRLNLGWCLATAFFLINFSAMKSPQYQMPLMIPLICSAALFPQIGNENVRWQTLKFLQHPASKILLRVVTVAFFAAQFLINLSILYGRIAPKWPGLLRY